MLESFVALLNAHPTYAYLWPELVLSMVAMAVLVFDLFLPEDRKGMLGVLGIAGMLYTGVHIIARPVADISRVSDIVTSMVQQDNYARLFNLIFLVAGIVTILFGMRYRPLKRYVGEFYLFVLLAVLSFMFVASSINMLMVYLCIEFVAVCSYVMAAYQKEDSKSQEGALKYLLIGSVSSAFLLYGISLLFGLSGSLDINDIGRCLRDAGAADRPVLLFSFVFVLVGFGFKIAMVPFHMWCPEAYEGAPTPVTAFFSVAPKAAGLAVMMRVFLAVFRDTQVPWLNVLEVLAILTMTLGNVVALWQTNIKRLMAYSSIAHVGYLLIGLIVAGSLGLGNDLGRQGLFAAIIYIVAYLLMNLGAFGVIIAVSNALGSDSIERYAGLGRRMPFLAVALTIFFLSLAGIPPTVGFIGKFFLFKAAIETRFYILSIFLVVNSVTSVYYYWNIVRTMFIDEPAEAAPIRAGGVLNLVAAGLVVAVIALGVFFEQLMAVVQSALL